MLELPQSASLTAPSSEGAFGLIKPVASSAEIAKKGALTGAPFIVSFFPSQNTEKLHRAHTANSIKEPEQLPHAFHAACLSS